MNFQNRILLSFVLLPKKFYEKIGVNTRHLKAILTTKLIMDDRRPNTWQQIKQQEKKVSNKATLLTMFVSALMGCIFLFSFSVGNDKITQLTVLFSFFITFLACMLIADFTNVLIDVRDNYIILPKPISDKTFVLSRLLHIFIHVVKVVLPLSLPSFIYLWVTTSFYGALLLVPFFLLATLFTIFLINAVYILILKLTTPQKFQQVISYIQIVFAIVSYAAYQLVPRMINKFNLSSYSMPDSNGYLFLPSYWFAGGWQQLFQAHAGFKPWLCLGLSIVIPFVSVWIVIKFFAPSFNSKLSQISGSGEVLIKASARKKQTAFTGYSYFFAKLLTRKGGERTGFLITWKMMLRSRDFKMKVYPVIGYLIVLIVMSMINKFQTTITDIRNQTGQGPVYILSIIYLTSFLMTSALGNLGISERYKSAWIYFTAPVKTPGIIVSGALKAALVHFFLPLGVCVAIVLFAVCGITVLPNIILGFCNQLLIMGLFAYFTSHKLPFSSPPEGAGGKSNFMRALMALFISAILVVGHYFVYRITPVLYIFSAMSLAAGWMILDSIKKYGWNKIDGTYRD
ncbi:MAG: hypothetical protein J0I41_13765 [Filimonas sp.]|nr:hypothetical protein [Filimonas sp.]